MLCLTKVLALQCVGALAEALGPEWKAYAEDLLIPSVLTGVSNALADTLHKVSALNLRPRFRGYLMLLRRFAMLLYLGCKTM